MTRSSTPNEQDSILGFCHIEKCAGTSLIHVLRRNYFLTNAAVRPMRIGADSNFSAADLRTMFRMNPYLRCIMGHAVVPYGDLSSAGISIRFITQLREPVSRTLSQYRFWVQEMHKTVELEEFISHPTASNYQVKKIAGEENLERAKEILERDFLLAGTVDRFDDFLVLLAKILDRPLSHFTYQQKNVAPSHQSMDVTDEIRERVLQHNLLDLELYEWVRTVLFERDVGRYGESFSRDRDLFRVLQKSPASNISQRAVDYIYRNCYLKPVSGAIRLANGLPYLGSYAYPRRGNTAR